ncbi:unnamed protein product [Schistosoma rodhaini]|uniref:SHR-BD domain-containing protein n=1 Tax=Schistosoma rodhaini TaxID=6188 RepID=A0AA85GJU8_9TREM|nr:unnamed protein product [Schistosoma rodhaini]
MNISNMKLNNVHYPFIIIIISCIILETVSEFMGNTYLSSNENPQESEDSTFRLLQESKEYLYFQWNPFKREYYGALFLELEDGVSRQMPDDVEEATLKTVGPACEVQTYSLRQSVGRAIVGYYDKELRELNFKRIFRVQHGTLTRINDKSINLTWEIEDEICSTEDLIIIFKKDSSGFHRMYTVTVNEKIFNFMEELHNDEHVIMTTYHESSFGLSELGKFSLAFHITTLI